ncbi:S8 family serine peptidase [Desulforudis sp. 1088]
MLFSLAGPALAAKTLKSVKPHKNADYVAGQVLVKFKETQGKAAARSSVAAAHRLSRVRDLPTSTVLYDTGGRNVEDVVAELMRDPAVEYAQPNYIYRIAADPNDPLWDQQWGLINTVYGVQAEQAWSYTKGSESVVVAVIDTGVDLTHPDLAGQLVKGYDFVNEDDDPTDDHGHGTHVAGIIAAVADNSEGITGAAPNVKIMPLKAGDALGYFATTDIVRAIDYAWQNGAKIVNMSFGGTDNFDYEEYNAIKKYPGMLFIAAAGNGGDDHLGDDNDSSPTWPASFTVSHTIGGVTYPALPNIVSVAALAPTGEFASFSNYGVQSVTLAAPGDDIVSTVPAYEGAGMALAVSDSVYNYKAVFWGFGAEDLDDASGGTSTEGAVYDSIVRAVYYGLGLTPADTQGPLGKPLLVVDDDQDGTYTYYDPLYGQGTLPDVSHYYLDALSTAGYAYELYDVGNGKDGPTVSTATYSGVIWFTGHTADSNPGVGSPPANLTDTDQTNLIGYLKAGGKLFLSGRDAGWDYPANDFCNSELFTVYLDVYFVGENDGYSFCAVRGTGDAYSGSYYKFNIPNVFLDILRSNTGDKSSIALDIEPYHAYDGTSMAAPFVSAGAALALSLRSNLSISQLVDSLKKVTPLANLNDKVVTKGTLNLAAALAYVNSLPTGGGGGGGGAGGGAPPIVPTDGASQKISAATGGSLSYEGVTVQIPWTALTADTTFTVKKLTVREISGLAPSGPSLKLDGDIYEITTDRETTFKDFITIKLPTTSERGVVHYYDTKAARWVPVKTAIEKDANGKPQYAVISINHLTRFAVFVPEPKVIRSTVGELTVTVNGGPRALDAAPYIDPQSGRTLVPVRFVSEALGAEVDWAAAARQVVIKDMDREIVLTIGAQSVLVDGAPAALEAPAVINGQRTFVPLRFVSETLGAKVDYSPVSREITIVR